MRAGYCRFEHADQIRLPPRRLPGSLVLAVDEESEAAIEAEQQGWLGEAEGLKVSLAATDAKLAQVDGLIARRDAAVSLGMPAFRDIVGRTTVADRT